MDIKTLKSDANREVEGVWREIGDGAALLVARLGNQRYRSEFQRRAKPYRHQARGGVLPEDVAERILVECLASAVLLDWKGLEEGGEALPYSRENAIRLLSDPEYRDFRDLVVTLSEDAEAYRQESIEDAAKN